MGKQEWKPGNMLYPLPAVLVSCQSEARGTNIMTVAWTGTLCTNPPMVYISVRPERFSYKIIENSQEFVINLTTEKMVEMTDFCGVKSGKDVDKFAYFNLTKEKASVVKAPLVGESPVNIECRVRQIIPLGSHHMIMADVVCVHVEEKYIDKRNRLALDKAGLIVYSHGEYYSLGKLLGSFGYSVRKKRQ